MPKKRERLGDFRHLNSWAEARSRRPVPRKDRAGGPCHREMETLGQGRGRRCCGKATWGACGRHAQRHVSDLGVWEAWASPTPWPSYKIEILIMPSESCARLQGGQKLTGCAPRCSANANSTPTIVRRCHRSRDHPASRRPAGPARGGLPRGRAVTRGWPLTGLWQELPRLPPSAGGQSILCASVPRSHLKAPTLMTSRTHSKVRTHGYKLCKV